MGRRSGIRIGIGVLLFTLFTVCSMIFSGTKTVEAKYFSHSYILEQAKGRAPKLKAYVTGKDISGECRFSGELAGETELSQVGKPSAFHKSGEGIHYIVLLDNSASVDAGQFKEVKKQLAAMRRNLKKQDKMSLYLVGTKSASGVKKRAGKIKKIKRDKGKKSKTVLYRSLNEVLAENASPGIRTVVLLITDGEDDSAGKSNSKQSTLKNVQLATIPIYCIMLRNVAKKPNKEKMKNTFLIMEEKNSRGYCADCSGGGAAKKIKKAFSDIQDIIRNKTYVVNFRAPNNKPAKGTVTIELSAKKGKQVVQVPVISRTDYSASVPDTKAPVIGEIKKEKSNAVSFTVTDNSGTVCGAEEASNYIVKTKKEDGKVWNISSASYNRVDHTAVLTFTEDLYTGDYVLICNNIRDDSWEENMISRPYEFHFEGLDEQTERRKDFVRSYWWTVVIFLVLTVGLILIIIIKKKPPQIVEIPQEDPVKADLKRIGLTITDRRGTIKDVEWNVEGSLFIGRSDMCNIYFDDDRLSKQHFVIEVTKTACYIEDLESTNGTFVNGVKMNSRRMLLDGDVITAGREKFVFHTLKSVVNEIS